MKIIKYNFMRAFYNFLSYRIKSLQGGGYPTNLIDTFAYSKVSKKLKAILLYILTKY
jgi:hypothetical protein